MFDVVRPDKDVDGFHPINVGLLVQNRATLVACTPSGVIELLERSNIAIAGARAVVIGRSDIVGKPMALLLLHRHATVTICHSRTANLPRVAARSRHPGLGDRPSGIRDRGFREAGSRGRRRRHDAGQRSGDRGAALPARLEAS